MVKKRPRFSNCRQKIPKACLSVRQRQLETQETQLEIHNVLRKAEGVGGASHRGALGTSSGEDCVRPTGKENARRRPQVYAEVSALVESEAFGRGPGTVVECGCQQAGTEQTHSGPNTH